MDSCTTECVICADEITTKTGRTIMGCGHEFHMKCLFQWLQKPDGTATCPCCRREPGEMERLVSPDDDDDYDEDYDEELDNFEEQMLLRLTSIAMEIVIPPNSQIGICATKIQKMWRGFSVRRHYDAAKILISL